MHEIVVNGQIVTPNRNWFHHIYTKEVVNGTIKLFLAVFPIKDGTIQFENQGCFKSEFRVIVLEWFIFNSQDSRGISTTPSGK